MQNNNKILSHQQIATKHMMGVWIHIKRGNYHNTNRTNNIGRY